MNGQSPRTLCAIALLIALMAGSFVAVPGCGPKKPKKSTTSSSSLYRAVKPPPPVPPRVAMTLDPALRQQAKQEILNASVSTDPKLRAHAIEGIKDGVGIEAADTIIKGMTDNDRTVRFASAVAAGELRLTQAEAQLLVLSDDVDPSVRVGAKFALHRIGDKRQSHDLELTAKDPNPRTRGDTAMVLGLLGEPSATRILLPMLFDPNSAIRLQAAESLWRLGDEHGLEALVSMTLSKYPDDRLIALLALAGPRDQRVLGHIDGQLTNEYDEVCLVAARAAGMLGSDQGLGVALKGMKSTDPRQRLLACLAMGAIGRSDSQQQLSLLLHDADPDVRIAAATALLQLKAS
jgi:HEAT repeat protein